MSLKMQRNSFFLLFFFFFLSGCCLPQSIEYSKIPEWVYNLPVDGNYAYIVGSAPIIRDVPVHKIIEKAQNNALMGLSQIKSFKIISKAEDRNIKNVNLSKELQRISSSSSLGAQQVSLWIDQEGITGEKQVFILMKMPY